MSVDIRKCILVVCSFLLMASLSAGQERKELFVSDKPSRVHYRIPALAALHDGTLISVSDYRHSGHDIGVVKDGRIDLMMRISPDNGHTWGAAFPLVTGQGAQSPDFFHVAFGDPCIVADRESDKVMVISCAGNLSFWQGTREAHQSIARFYSDDKGKTWSEAEDITESIYKLFDNSSAGPSRSMFITSGRIMQSRSVKKGRYHRLYLALPQICGDGVRRNYVLFSDDFGLTWSVLGGTDVVPVEGGADEAKVEELPNGDIMITSRTEAGGRNVNVFMFRNMRKAEGEWGRMAHSGVHNNGIVTEDNACNGELMLVPAVRKSDGRRICLLLQSVPFGPKRTNVGIYYKGIESERKTYLPEELAADWEGRFPVTDKGSAYSVMAWQKNGKLGFVYEENTYFPPGPDAMGYTIVYECFSIEEITGGAYEYDPKGW